MAFSDKLLEIIPAQKVIQQVRCKYACKACEGLETEGPMVKMAPAPAEILPKAMATVSTFVAIVIAKFCDALPLERQEKIFARMGIDLSRSTMVGWRIKIAQKLEPIMAQLKAALLSGPLIQVDETPLRVLNETGRSNTTQSGPNPPRGKPAVPRWPWARLSKTTFGPWPWVGKTGSLPAIPAGLILSCFR